MSSSIDAVQEESLNGIRQHLFTSSTKQRVSQLHALSSKIVNNDIPKNAALVILEYLETTYPYYVDRTSRQAAQKCLTALLNCDAGDELLPALERFLRNEASKTTLAPASIFVLIEWSSIVLQRLADNQKRWETWGWKVLACDAKFLAHCLYSNKRESRNQSAKSVTRRALRKVFKSPEIGVAALKESISNLAVKGASSADSAILLGIIAGVSSRDPGLSLVVEERKSDYYEFYVRDIIGSRTILPQHIANGLSDFFISFSTEKDLIQHIVPALEKALLRAPEIILNDLITPLLSSLPTNLDLSEILRSHLLKPLMANVKSSNAIIRNGAVSAFGKIAQNCTDEVSMAAVAGEVLKPLKDTKASSPEQRVCYSSMLSSIAATKSLVDILPTIASISSKEANEAALAAETRALIQFLPYSVVNIGEIDLSVSKAFTQGLHDKKISVRKIWTLRFGELLWGLNSDDLSQPSVSEFCTTIFGVLKADWSEVLKNPIPAANSGLVTVAIVYVALVFSKSIEVDKTRLLPALPKSELLQELNGLDGRPSFLFNSRVYTKLHSQDDLLWILRAFQATAEGIFTGKGLSNASDGWAQAFIYMITAASISAPIRKDARSSLSAVYARHPTSVSAVITENLAKWLQSVALEEKDGPALSTKTCTDHLYFVVRSICLSSDEIDALPSSQKTIVKDTILNELVQMNVLCRSPLITRVPWIELCLRCGVDPKKLVSDRSDELLQQIVRLAQGTKDFYSRQTHLAACDAAAELAFIAPDVITPKLVELIKNDLDQTQFKTIGLTEAAIFRTQEGTTFVDVLSQKSTVLPDKSTKDYDTLKWEQDLRDQLAKKQGQQKKLSSDDQAKVNAQLKKEAEIRSLVGDIVLKLHRGASIIQSLATGPPTDVESWIGQAVSSLLQAMKADTGVIFGEAGVNAYLSCATKVSQRLGTLRTFIGVATLRSYNVSSLPMQLMQEPLGELVTRVLYRLRFSAEQRPFDIVSLDYILPLISVVLERGGVGRATGEESDEQITLALEFISYHTDLFSNPHLPRREILDLLLRSMQKYKQHYRVLKDCLQDVCHALAPDATDSEISVLLRGCVLPEEGVRASALQAIDTELELNESSFIVEIWISRCDINERNAEMAEAIWEENSLKIEEASAATILPYLESKDQSLRTSAALALSKCVREQRGVFTTILHNLQESYREKAKPRVPERDAYGMVRKMDLTDPWEARHGIAAAFKELTGVFNMANLVEFVQFLVESGPLADRNDTVREEMIQAGTLLISRRGAAKVEELMGIFENTLEAPDTGTTEHDMVNEAVIILYGALARHLKSGDPRISKVINRLLVTLSTPSEPVQIAISQCLPPLIRNSHPETSQYVQHVMADLLQSKKYATQRGAAFGLAGIIQGRGISAFKEFRILSSLKTAAEDKKDVSKRSGAFIAYEVLSLSLGAVFEPYVIRLVPQLLAGFGDSNAEVRANCLDAAKTCFATLSSFGAKNVLPILLEGLDDDQWRSKKGACDSLGAMAHLDPQQLAISLPDIIPPLTNVLNDSHKEVRAAANKSLQEFGEVISNPEIKSVVDILLKALSDPTKYTDEALDSLLKVSFVHYLDAPSLALIVRILERGLGDRSATKRKASQIIGSLAHLADRKDLTSNLPILVSGLRVAAVDPVPTTRATASKALGSLVEKLGEDALPDLIPSLMSTLKTDTGAGDRLGSAQALSEVLAGLGIDRLEATLPSILQNVSSTKPAVREGFMSLFIFLPACFGNSFANYLSKIIPPILAGLADEIESIRETSLRAGRLLVKNFATRAIDLLLPELQRGLADYNHRIRLSSVELVGDLLFNLTGITAKSEQEEEEENVTAAGQSLLEVLGEEKRNNILSALYISRCDTSGLVRTASINVWKALVATPKTLREITPTLTQMIIRRLASSNMEQKIIAGNALGELIRKAGDGVLASLVPTLEEGLLTSVDTDAKQGICIALRELIMSASADNLEDHEANISSVVRTALTDPNADVREAAAEAFDSLQRLFGKRVVDQILPHLLGLLRNPDEADDALAALLTLLTDNTRSSMILPNLLPTLLAAPISTFNARAVASLAGVAGLGMTRRLPHILNALLDNIITCDDQDRLEALDSAFDAVLLSIDEGDSLHTGMSAMLELVKHSDHRKRRSADMHLANFFASAEIDYSSYYPELIRALLLSFEDSETGVVKAAWLALSELRSKLRKEEMEDLVTSTRQVLKQVGVPGHNLPGFQLPKGINAILPIFLQGLINGSMEQRQQSAMAISDIIARTGEDALKPFVTQITGPLIRVVSERSVDVKSAILVTLNDLLEKIPAALKPFLPQLQRTFTKALADPSSEVLRSRAAKALGTLITLTPRIDPIISELVSGTKTTDEGVKNAMQKALYEVVSKAGGNMTESSRTAVLGLIDTDSVSADYTTTITNARLLGALVKNLPPEAATSLIKSRVVPHQISKSSILSLNAVLLDSPAALNTSFSTEATSTIVRGIASPDSTISENAVLAAGKYLLSEPGNFEATKPIFEALGPVAQPGAPIDTRRLALVVIRTVARLHNDMVRPHLTLLSGPVFSSVRDPVIPIKLGAEAAFLALFDVVEEEGAVFEKFLANATDMAPATKRAMQDYFKRVAMRLGAQARERRDAEGGLKGGLGLSSDEVEDEREIWSVGKVDFGETSFDA